MHIEQPLILFIAVVVDRGQLHLGRVFGRILRSRSLGCSLNHLRLAMDGYVRLSHSRCHLFAVNSCTRSNAHKKMCIRTHSQHLWAVEIALLALVQAWMISVSAHILICLPNKMGVLLRLTLFLNDLVDIEIAKAGRAAKVGSKTARFARFVRLIRILRLLRLFRLAKYMKSSGPGSTFGKEKVTKDEEDEDNDEDAGVEIIYSADHKADHSLEEYRNYKQHQETSKKMADDVTDQVSQRVVLLVLLVMVTVSFLQPDVEDTARQSGMLIIYAMNVTAQSSVEYLQAYNETVRSYMQTKNLLYLKTFGEVHKPFAAAERDLFRQEEIDEITIVNASNAIDDKFLAMFDQRETMRRHATLNLVLVVLTIFYLVSLPLGHPAALSFPHALSFLVVTDEMILFLCRFL